VEPTIDATAEKAKAEQVIKRSIQWIVDKDKELMYTYFVHDSSLFWFSPDNAGTIQGFDNFKKLVEQVFMNPKFKGVSSDFKDLRIDLSRSGECAWWSCYLDDFNEWDGRPSNWENVRWTGVLEKIDGQWRIRQMHFSYSAEAMQAEIQKAVESAKAGK
jgi:ketosteroid isomerase-like protein